MQKYKQMYSRKGCEMVPREDGEYIMVSDIVFCKDCIYRDLSTNRGNWKWCASTGLWTADNWFCASGERKDKK